MLIFILRIWFAERQSWCFSNFKLARFSGSFVSLSDVGLFCLFFLWCRVLFPCGLYVLLWRCCWTGLTFNFIFVLIGSLWWRFFVCCCCCGFVFLCFGRSLRLAFTCLSLLAFVCLFWRCLCLLFFVFVCSPFSLLWFCVCLRLYYMLWFCVVFFLSCFCILLCFSRSL